jgi:hypothetical protein
MRLKRPDQSQRGRVAVFVAVVGLHILAALLIFAAGTGTIRIARLRAVDAPLSLLWLSRESSAQRPVTSAATAPEHKLKKPEAARDIDRPPEVAAAEPSNAITLPSDLSGNADLVAHRQADNEENERGRRNLAGPSESQLDWSRNNLPLVHGYHQRGDNERAEGGELIAWMNDKCFYTNHGISTFGLPQTSMVCKDPPKPETDLFKDMRKKLDESAKGSAP